jgi:hypothetical protein
MQRRTFASPLAIACIIAIGLGCLIRARPVLLTDFPLNDGGLFYQMTAELQRAHYHIPAYTAYNSADIPFAYPPFGFYVAGMLADATSWDLLQIVRVLPLVVTCAALVAFFFLARAMLTERVAIAAAIAAFAFVPRSFTWLIMGGGLTRAFGFLFTILALHQAYLLFTRRELRFAVTAGVFTGLTPLSHLGTAPFLAASLIVFFLAYGRHARGLSGMAIIGIVAIAVSAPWWLSVVRMHGFAPFLAAGQTGGSILTPGQLRETVLGRLARLGAEATGEPLFPVIGALAVLGSLACLRSRRLTLPIWWVVTLAVDARAGATYATLPVSLLAGLGVNDVLMPLLTSRGEAAAATAPVVAQPEGPAWRQWRRALRARSVVAAVVAFFVVYCSLAALSRNSDLGGEGGYLASVSHDERDAMRWVADNTPPTSRFFVVPEDGWPADRVAEWFPVLAARPSVATVQGREWLPNGDFARYNALYPVARECGGADVRCLDQWNDSAGMAFSHVFIPKAPNGACCRRLSASLRADPRYALVFDGPGAEIFARRDWGDMH